MEGIMEEGGSTAVAAGTVVLSGDLTIERAAELRETLLAALKENGSIVVGLEGVTGVDLSFLQLLCATHRALFLTDKTVSIRGADRELLSGIMEASGFTRHIGCPEDVKTQICIWKTRRT
jgi:anti-anti-sigma regulatory factor